MLELKDRNPEQVEYKNNLAISNEKLGNTYSLLGELDTAKGYYEQATELFEQLHHDYPEQVGYKNSLAISYSKLYRLYLQMEAPDKAVEYLKAAASLWWVLARDFPAYAEFQSNWNWAQVEMKKMGVELEDLE